MPQPTTSTLRDLPAELRNTIYSLVLVSPNSIHITTAHHQEPPLCRELPAEARPIFYAENTFRYAAQTGSQDLLKYEAKNVVKWMRKAGQKFKLVEIVFLSERARENGRMFFDGRVLRGKGVDVEDKAVRLRVLGDD